VRPSSEGPGRDGIGRWIARRTPVLLRRRPSCRVNTVKVGVQLRLLRPVVLQAGRRDGQLHLRDLLDLQLGLAAQQHRRASGYPSSDAVAARPFAARSHSCALHDFIACEL